MTTALSVLTGIIVGFAIMGALAIVVGAARKIRGKS